MVNLIISRDNVVRRLVTGGAAALLATMLALPANAIEYSYGEVSGSIDTIVSAGASMRTSGRDCENIGTGNGGCKKFDASGIDKTVGAGSGDDGNLNYDQWDVFSGAMKATSEVLANYRNFNMFVRGTGFYDPLITDTDFRDLDSPQASEVERNAKLLDYFVGGSFDVGGRPVDIRLGNQVISWGESTFIQNGINVINPIDVAAVRKPGSEIKEFFIPVLAAKGSIGLPGNVSAEAFYQFKSDNIVPDPAGTFFSSADIVGRGSQPIRLGVSDQGDDDPDGVLNELALLRGLDLDGHFRPDCVAVGGVIPVSCFASSTGAPGTGPAGAEPFSGWATPVNQAYGVQPLLVNTSSATIERNNDLNADDGGEGGFALRYFSEELNQGTEFGMFFMNVHSRLPLVSLTRANAATGYAPGTPGFNLNQFSARGAANPASATGFGATPTQNQIDAFITQGALPAGTTVASITAAQISANAGGLPGAFAQYLSGVGSGAGNTAVDGYEVAQFACNVLVAQNRNAIIGRGVGSAQGGALPGFTGAPGNAAVTNPTVDLSLPGGYTNCTNSTRLRRGFNASVDRVLTILPAQTIQYRLQYPEDIKLFGLSANTTVGPLAVQGEVAYRHEQPLQYALGEMLRASLDGVGVTAFATGAGSPVDVNGAAAGNGYTVAANSGNANAVSHTVADLDVIADGAVAAGTRGHFEPLDSQQGRAVAATTAQLATIAALGAPAVAAATCTTICTFLEVANFEQFGTLGGLIPTALTAAQARTLGGTTLAGDPTGDLAAAAFQCGAGRCATLAAANASSGRTFGLAAAAALAATGSLPVGFDIGAAADGPGGAGVTALQAATWNELGYVVLDPVAVGVPLGGASFAASSAVISAMPNDMTFSRHADGRTATGLTPVAAITQGSIIDQTAFGSDGFIEAPVEDVYTAQTTLTSLLYGSNPVVEFLNADSGVTVSEFGMVWVPGVSLNDGLASSNTQGSVLASANQVYKVNPDMLNPANYATAFSWGAQGIFNFTYNRVFGSPINLVPGVAWKWDLGGRTPAPLGNYMAERKAIGLSVGANYQNRWTGSLSWTMNFGPNAPLNDRDFAAATISYSF